VAKAVVGALKPRVRGNYALIPAIAYSMIRGFLKEGNHG
jgi:hypothetical protein